MQSEIILCSDHFCCHRRERGLQASTSQVQESPARSRGRLRTSPQPKFPGTSGTRLGLKRRASGLGIPTEGLGVPPEKPSTPPMESPRGGSAALPAERSPAKAPAGDINMQVAAHMPDGLSAKLALCKACQDCLVLVLCCQSRDDSQVGARALHAL